MIVLMVSVLKHRWQQRGGYADILRLAMPLILSMGMHTLQTFLDRVMLMGYSTDAMAAALPAAITLFTVNSFFMGTAGYVNTFVAQYTGAARDHRIGPAVWQGIFFALFATVVLVSLRTIACPLFNWIAHEPAVRDNEIIYFKVLCVASGPLIVSMALAGFFTGRGKTWVVLGVTILSALVNLVLDYILIYGHLGLPAMGIRGAGWATVCGNCTGMLVYLILFFRRGNRVRYATASGVRWDGDLFKRLLRFGLPNGAQLFLEHSAFAMFIALVGRIDTIALAATNIAFDINCLAFMPMIGLGTALTILVGQAMGKEDPSLAQRTAWNAFTLTSGYMILLALGFWFIPDVFIFPFAMLCSGQFDQISTLIHVLIRFVAFYCLFDAANIVFVAVLRGAGDTRFVMVVSVVLSWLVMAIPSWLAIRYAWGPYRGLYAAWCFITAFVILLASAFFLRFLQGKWKHIRVIEAAPVALDTALPELPGTN